MLTRNDCKRIDTLEHAAEAQGFAVRWGGRQVRAWVETWIDKRELPASRRGVHIKIFTLLDPEIRAELRSYIHSSKWAMDPAKLADFSAQQMLPAAAKSYGSNLMSKELLKGLKQYLEVSLLPW